MASGGAIDIFNDYIFATGRAVIGGPRDLQVEAKKHTYHIARVTDGEISGTHLLQGGRSVSKNLIFKDTGTFGPYLPGEFRNYVNPQRLQKAETFFRYYECHSSWIEQEILQNEAIAAAMSVGNYGAMYHQFASIKAEKQALADATQWNGMEASLWLQPDAATMEGESNGDKKMRAWSLPAFINEYTDGLWGTGVGGSVVAFTTKQGLTPSSADLDGRYKPQQDTYANITAGSATNLLAACDRIIQDLKWQLPLSIQQWQADVSMKKRVVITSKKGRANLAFLQREGNDRFALGFQDAGWPDPQIYGIPVQRSEDFERGAYYPAAGNTVNTEDNATVTGPRYIFWDGNYLWPYFHREKYMVADRPMRDFNVPDGWVMRRTTWFNWLCVSMQAQGHLKPSASV